MKNINKYQTISMSIYKFLLVSIILFIGAFAVAPTAAYAANFYWYGGTGSWSDNINKEI